MRLNIEGVGSITVDDSFKTLSPEQQNATVDEIVAARVGASAGADAPPRPSGIANNIGAGLAEGAVNLATMGGNVREGVLGGAQWLAGKIGVPQETSQPIRERASQAMRYIGGPLSGPTSEQAWSGIEPITGPRPEAKTPEEKFVRGAAQFVPGGMASMPRNLIRGAVNYGVVPGAASEYLGQRAEGTKYEGPMRMAGALLGVGAGAGIDRGVTGVRNYLATRGAASELSDVLGSRVGSGATRRVAGSAMADALTPGGVAARQAELGPETMVMDLGRQLRGRAESVAAQPGRGQNTVLDAVEGRTGRFGEGTAQRVEQTLNAEMGPTHNVVELVDRVNATVDRVAGPLYKKVMAAHPVVEVPPEITSRPAIRQAMGNAKELAANYGETITVDAKPSLRAWDYIKKDLDRRINAYQRSGGTSELNSADKADLGGLMDARRALVEYLDGVTKGSYKEARQASATKFELREALEYGRSAFNSRLLPEEFAAELAEMSVPQRTMAQVGFRRELDRLIETTRNEGAAARRILDTDSVLQKTELLFGRDAAREISRRINAENVFQETTQDIARNSRTAVRQQLIKDTSTPSSSEVRGASLPGLAWSGARGILNYGRGQGLERTRNQIADILTASGPQINPVVATLLKLGNKKTMNNAVSGNKAAALINALLSQQ